MALPELTAEHCHEVLNVEIQIGKVFISDKVDHRITYHVEDCVYYVYKDGEIEYSTTCQRNALDRYNKMNKKVDL